MTIILKTADRLNKEARSVERLKGRPIVDALLGLFSVLGIAASLIVIYSVLMRGMLP